MDTPPAIRFLTAALHVDYLRPTPLGVPLELRGRVKEYRGRKVVVSVLVSANPHVCQLRTTQTLLIRNRNPIGDSAKIDTLQNPPINITLPVSVEVSQRFLVPERVPARISCSLHPWEAAWLLLREDPYMAVSDADGKFEIRNLPMGKWTFQVWHEHTGYVTQVKTGGKATTWPRGRVELPIKLGDNDLGELLLPAALFAK